MPGLEGFDVVSQLHHNLEGLAFSSLLVAECLLVS